MTYKKRLISCLWDVDKTLAIAGTILAAIFIILIYIYAGHLGYLPTNLLFFPLLIICFCLLWLGLQKDELLKFHPPGSDSRVKFWSLVFFILYILSTLVVYYRPNLYERPLIYFVLAILMAGAIACEICTAKQQPVVFILIQELMLAINLVASLLLIVPSLVGGDPWYHCDLATRILNEYNIPNGYGYSAMPFFHLTVAVTSIFTTLPYKFATMASVTLGQIVIDCVFIFLISNFLFKNYRIGLLAGFLVIIGDQHIIRSIAPIPNSFGYVFIIITLYLIFAKFKGKYNISAYILLGLSMTPIILIHSLPALMMTIFLFTVWITFYFCKEFFLQKIQYIRLLIPLVFCLTMLSWWYYMSTQANDATKILAEAMSLSANAYSPIPDIVASAATINSNEILFLNLGLYAFISISLIGFFYMISRRGDEFTFTFALLSIIPFMIYILMYALSGFVYSENFNVLSDRWLNLTLILISVPLALSIYSMGTYWIQNTNCLSFFLGGLIILLSMLMILTPAGSPDNHIFTPSKQYWSYYTESEISGSELFAFKSSGMLSSDRDYAVHTSSSIFQHIYGIDSNRLLMLDLEIQSGIFDHDNSIKIFRERRTLEFQRAGVFSPKIQPDLETYLSRCGFNKIYESPTITGYI